MEAAPRHAAAGRVVELDGLDGSGVSPELVAVVRRRLAVQDEAAEALERSLATIIQRIGKELRTVMGRGEVDDGIRAAILRTRLDDMLDLVERAGAGIAQSEFFAGYAELRDLAEQTVDIAGVPRADRILDEPAARLALDAVADDHLAAWEDIIERPMASRIMSAMRSAVVGEALDDVVQRIETAERVKAHHAVTEARTRMAEFDRAAQEEAVSAAERGGSDDLVRVYLGPLDGITRPFCRRHVGRWYSRAEIAKMDNGQTSVSPLFSGGGYNCRHSWVAMTRESAREAGIERGEAGAGE